MPPGAQGPKNNYPTFPNAAGIGSGTGYATPQNAPEAFPVPMVPGPPQHAPAGLQTPLEGTLDSPWAEIWLDNNPWAGLYADDQNPWPAYRHALDATIGDHSHPVPNPFLHSARGDELDQRVNQREGERRAIQGPTTVTPLEPTYRSDPSNLTLGPPSRKILEMGDPALWAVSPSQLGQSMHGESAVGMSPWSGDDLLSHELHKRYGAGSPEQMAASFMGDIGLDPYEVSIVRSPQDREITMHDGTKTKAYADYAMQPGAPGHGHIKVYPLSQEKDAPPMDAILSHEIGHAADEIYGQDPYAQHMARPATATFPHHAGLENFEQDMAQSMAAQSALERGLPVDAGIAARMPWLKSVKPLSTNPLASPWSGLTPGLPPEIWNATKQGYSPEDYNRYSRSIDEERIQNDPPFVDGFEGLLHQMRQK